MTWPSPAYGCARRSPCWEPLSDPLGCVVMRLAPVARRRRPPPSPCARAAATAGTASASDDGAAARWRSGFYPYAFVAERVGGDGRRRSRTSPSRAASRTTSSSRPQQVGALARGRPRRLLRGLPAGRRRGRRAAGRRPGVRRAVGGRAARRRASTPTSEHADEHDDEARRRPARLARPAAARDDRRRALADRLAELDPDGADGLPRARRRSCGTELTALDDELRAGLGDLRAHARSSPATTPSATSPTRTVWSRSPIAGLSPEDEASPAAAGRGRGARPRQDGVTTIFFEELVSPKVAESLAREVGATGDRPDPLEGRAGDRRLPHRHARQPGDACARRSAARERDGAEPGRPPAVGVGRRTTAGPALRGVDLQRRRRRGRRRARRQRLGQEHPGPGGRSGCCRWRPARSSCSARRRERFRDWPRIGYVPQRAGAGDRRARPPCARSSRPAGCALHRLAPAARRPTARPSTRALDAVGLADRARRQRRARCPAGSSSGSSSPGRWPASPTCSCWTSRPPASTSPARRRSPRRCAALVARGTTVVLVAHELGPMHAAHHARRDAWPTAGCCTTAPPPEPDHLHLHDPEHAHPVHERTRRRRSPAWGLR